MITILLRKFLIILISYFADELGTLFCPIIGSPLVSYSHLSTDLSRHIHVTLKLSNMARNSNLAEIFFYIFSFNFVLDLTSHQHLFISCTAISTSVEYHRRTQLKWEW